MKAVGENKRCSCCKEWKHVSDFGLNRSAPDGWTSWCKECCKAFRERNRGKLTEKNKAYYWKNREKIVGKGRAYYKAYREKNREKIVESSKAYYERNREKILEKNKAYRERNLERLAIYKIKRRIEYRFMKEKLAELGITV